jgi:hypothetical protein
MHIRQFLRIYSNKKRTLTVQMLQMPPNRTLYIFDVNLPLIKNIAINRIAKDTHDKDNVRME